MAFFVQNLIYTVNIWINFVFGSYFEQDHQLNLIIIFYRSLLEKMTWCAYFKIETVAQKDAAQNLIDYFFSNFDWQRAFP